MLTTIMLIILKEKKMVPNCFDLVTCLLIMLNNFMFANNIIFNWKYCSKNLKEYPVHKIFSLIQFACIYRNIGTYSLLLCNYVIQSALSQHGFRICTHTCTLLRVYQLYIRLHLSKLNVWYIHSQMIKVEFIKNKIINVGTVIEVV